MWYAARFQSLFPQVEPWKHEGDIFMPDLQRKCCFLWARAFQEGCGGNVQVMMGVWNRYWLKILIIIKWGGMVNRWWNFLILEPWFTIFRVWQFTISPSSSSIFTYPHPSFASLHLPIIWCFGTFCTQTLWRNWISDKWWYSSFSLNLKNSGLR